MSDVQPPIQNPVETSSAPPTPAPRSGGGLRLAILLIILLAALAGLLYDYQVARPAVAKARKALDQMLDGTTKDPNGDGTFSSDEVHQLIGREPDVVEAIEGGKKEIYYWQSGVPFRKYRIVIAYWGREHPLLNSYAINDDLREDQLPPKGNIQVPDLTEEQKKNFKPQWPMASGPGGGRPGSGQNGSAGPDKKKSPTHKKRTKGGGGRMGAIAPPVGETPTDEEKPVTPAKKPQESEAASKAAGQDKPKAAPPKKETDAEPAPEKPAQKAEAEAKKETAADKPKSEPAKPKPPEKKADTTTKEPEKKDDGKKGS